MTVDVPGGKLSPGLCELLRVKEQLSEAEGEAQVTAGLQFRVLGVTVWFAGQFAIWGEVVSTLVTAIVQVVLLLLPSVAVRVTVKAPGFVTRLFPAGDWVTVGEELQLSEACTNRL